MLPVWTGTLTKMRAEAGEAREPVRYSLADGWFEAELRTDDHPLNPHLGQRCELRFTGAICCVYCGRETRQTFGQGFCFPCSQNRAEADLCIVRPELCHYHDPANPCRDDNFALTQCFQPHYLYCALTSGIKVGITRERNIPSRWLDQGAVAAIPLAVLPSRREVGLVEKRLSEVGFADKTHWTRLLKGDPAPGEFDLGAAAADVVARLEEWGVGGVLPPERRIERRFTYPVLQWPAKVTSFNLDKDPLAGGVLQGIKGQYLIFDGGVINLRKYTGYKVEFLA